MRYDQLYTLVALYRPSSILEVGTNRGDRGIAMCEEALKHKAKVTYTGYDVFDTEEKYFHREAYNGKGFFSRTEVAGRFNDLQRRRPGLSYELIEGRTTYTLHGRSICADLVFIDGDHRVDIIRKDYFAVRRSRVVVFDDYYTATQSSKVDISQVGCNRVVEPLPGRIVLPMADNFPDTGDIRMAVVIRPHVFVRGRHVWLRLPA